MRVLLLSLVLMSSAAIAADGVRVVQNLDYVEGQDYADAKDKLDLYLPEAQAGFPVVVFFHGGGLTNGNKDGSVHVGQALASRGIGAAVVNYRLSPSVAHPDHAKDAARSTAWVHRNIGQYGGDPAKIFVSGHSAGAYLAALLVLDPRYLIHESMSPNDLAGAAPISGFFYVDKVAPDRSKDVWGEDPFDWLGASPSQFVRDDAPPMLLLYADGDDPWRREQNEDLKAALEAEGHKDVATVQIADRDHRGIHSSLAVDDVALEKIVSFVKRR